MEQFPQRGNVRCCAVFHTPRLCNTTGQVPDIRLPTHVACQGTTTSRAVTLSFSLMICPQVAYNFHHYFAVNLIVADNLIHQRQLAHRHALLPGFLVAAPRAHHRPQPVNGTVSPVRFDEAV